jgi:hypothetical protein
VNVTITVDTRAVEQMLRQVPQEAHRALVAATNDATTLALREMRTYPPPIAMRVSTSASGGARTHMGQRYRRTGTLRKSWFRTVQDNGYEVIGLVQSSGQIAPYNVYVQMQTMQSWVHAGRWRCARSLVCSRTSAS